jgi:signal transduction histidine kinase
MAEHKLQKIGIEVETNFDSAIPYVIGDPHQLQEVFFNIILNAIDAMPNGGHLTVETAGIGNFVDIKIIDTGIGIPQEELGNIFQPFYTTKPLGEGTGLGLPVSLEIVKKHNGTINVYSEAGVGTVFSITLPAASKIEDKTLNEEYRGDRIHNI